MTKPDKAIAPARDGAAPAADRLAATAHASGPLVINLCSSNTPMALVRPDAPELARFTFFVSRRREEGRERFRLHMGYFETRAEAEQLLTVVREVYPAAWVGDAPGQNLRPEGRPAPAAQPPRVPASQAGAVPTVVSPVVVSPAVVSPAAAPPAAPQPRPAERAAPIAASAAPAKPVVAPPTAAQRPAASVQAPALAPVPPLVSMRATPAPARPAPLQQSNVREVLAQLDGATPVARPTAAAPPAAPPAAKSRDMAPPAAAPRGAARTPAAPRATSAPPTAPPRSSVPVPTREELEYELLHGGAEATDSQVLRVLENRVAPESSAPSARRADALPREARDIPVQRPQDTMTWREIRQEMAREANVSFALQLVWSPNQIDVASVPPLAIFDAYTLYNVEVTRPNAKQYGLRLGFFSDAMSAKQVAAYVRSEFLSVAVVPVTLSERDQAQKSGGIQLARSVATPGNSMQAEEITLIDELTPPRPRAAAPVTPAATPQAANPNNAAAAKAPAAKAPSARPARPSRPRGGGPRTLEETLEILGASQLSIDNGKGERLNIGGRSRAAPDKRTSTFSKLLDRLSTRLKP